MLVKSYKYTLWGILTGIILIILVWVTGSYFSDLTLSLKSLVFLHNTFPTFYIIDILPLILGIIAYWIEKETFAIESKLDESLYRETEKSKKVLDFVNNLILDNFETTYEFTEENDKLGSTLIDLRDNLRNSKKEATVRKNEDDQRNWISEGLAKFGEILRQNNNDLITLSHNIIINLVKYLKANQGGFFMIEESADGVKYFQQTASYAYDRKKFASKRIELNEGLIGTSALERKTIFLTEVPDGYLNITSGLGKANPRCILIVPLIFNDDIHGAIELASFKKF